MKPKSKSTEPLASSDKPATAQFGQVSESVWRVSGKTMTIDEFIEDQAQHVNSIDISVLGAFSGRLLDKLKGTHADEYPGLREAVHVIIRVLESPRAQQTKDPLPRWLAETGFAAGYLLKRFDLIPDHVAEIGFADDALILQRVVRRNQSELHRRLAESFDLAVGNSPLEDPRCVNNKVTNRTN
jgi:uncharacterized membrane protein YkvA (DUF1232 family)